MILPDEDARATSRAGPRPRGFAPAPFFHGARPMGALQMVEQSGEYILHGSHLLLMSPPTRLDRAAWHNLESLVDNLRVPSIIRAERPAPLDLDEARIDRRQWALAVLLNPLDRDVVLPRDLRLPRRLLPAPPT